MPDDPLDIVLWGRRYEGRTGLQDDDELATEM
jgi:hypothetical protein